MKTIINSSNKFQLNVLSCPHTIFSPDLLHELICCCACFDARMHFQAC